MTSPSTAEPERTTGTSPRSHEDAARLLRKLTPREAQLLARLAAGEDLRSTARALGIAPGTARAQLNRAMRKLGAATTEEAVALATALAPARPGGPPPEPASPPAAPTAEPSADTERTGTASASDSSDFAGFAALVHTRLVQQTFLLTGNRHRAAHCVHLALGGAARRWAEVSAEADPEGRVRAEAFDLALSPWHRGGPRRVHLLHRPRRRIRVGEPVAPEAPEKLNHRDRALLKALRRLSRPQRRALVLHDTLGLSAERVAVEVESSTAAAAGRVLAARAALAREVPSLVGPDPADPEFGERLGDLLHRAAVHACPAPRLPSPALLAADSRVRGGLVTGAAGVLVVGVGATMVATLFGVGPSALVRPEQPAATACTSATTGSAGPAATDGAPGLQTPWCAPAPGVPARLVGPSAPAAAAPFTAPRPALAPPVPPFGHSPLPPPAGPCAPHRLCSPGA